MLGNEGNVLAHIVQGGVSHIHAVHAQGAGTDVVKSGQKAGKRGFPGAAGAYQAHHFPGADMNVNAVQHLAGAIVGEGNAVIVQTPGSSPQGNGIGGFRHGVRLLQQVVDAFQGGMRAFQVGQRHAQALEGVVTHEEGSGQGREVSLGDSHFMAPHQQNAQAQRRHHFQHRHQEVPVLHRSQIDLEEALDQPQEKPHLLFLHAVGTDFTLGRQVFLGGGRDIAQLVLRLLGLLHHAAAKEADGPYRQHNQPQIHQHHRRVRVNKDLVHQEGECGQQGKGLFDDVIGRYYQASLHVGRVIDEAADQVPPFLAVNEGEGQRLQFGKGVQPDFLQHLHADDADPVHIEERAYAPDGKNQRQQGTYGHEHSGVHVLRGHQMGNDVLKLRGNLRIVKHHREHLGNHQREAETAGGGGQRPGGQRGDEQLHHRLQIPRVLKKLS